MLLHGGMASVTPPGIFFRPTQNSTLQACKDITFTPVAVVPLLSAAELKPAGLQDPGHRLQGLFCSLPE